MLSLEEAVRLHGHLGPWLVLGYKIGLRAVELLGARSTDLFCTVYMPRRRPFTCALDGVQAATGCTLGKLNIELREGGVRFVFERRDGKRVAFRLREGVPALLEHLIGSLGAEEAARRILGMDLSELVEEGD